MELFRASLGERGAGKRYRIIKLGPIGNPLYVRADEYLKGGPLYGSYLNIERVVGEAVAA